MFNFLKRLWRMSPAACVLLAIAIAWITMTFVFMFTHIWPAAHDWLNSVPCPRGQPCPFVDPWFKGVVHP